MIGFVLPDIVLESIIRDGLANLRNEPDLIDDVFATLTLAYADAKYGATELQRIKNLILKKDIKVVHSFNEVTANLPCFSIQLGNDAEDKKLARLGDFEEDLDILLTDPIDIDNLTVVDPLVIDSYDILSGEIKVNDSVDLSAVYANLLVVDALGAEFKIIGGINNTIGEKTIFITPGSNLDTSGDGIIKSSLNFKRAEIRGVTHNVSLTVGVHAKNALTVKYMYVLLKYFLLSRKEDLHSRCFIVSSLSGSDFTRDMQYLGDIVFNRFLTVTGKVEDRWNNNDVILVDNFDLSVLVPPSEEEFPQTTESLGLESQTVQIADEDE